MTLDSASSAAENIVVGPTTSKEEEKLYVASQWQLIRWRFSQHKVAVISTWVLAFFYLIALFAEFVAPFDPHDFKARYVLAPPQSIHFVDVAGNFSLRPFVYDYLQERDPETLRRIYSEDTSKKHFIHFFMRGAPYKMWGVFETDIHLFGLAKEADVTMFLLGSDDLGRDMLSRIIYGARVSLSIGLMGVFLSFVLGVVLGGISGYYGGIIDLIIQRVIEFLRSIPAIPLWMGLAAAVPPDWPPLRTYFMITILLSFIGWTGMAREVRGRFLSLREEDFVLAARLQGASENRIILLHMVPSFYSHIIAVLTLAVPGMILAETSLSFLGLGLRAPVISWGVMLKSAQNVSSVALAPWLLLPVVAVIITILAFNFMGDGLRDAADPYAKV
jgi:peptide/nickel transport system permease protein